MEGLEAAAATYESGAYYFVEGFAISEEPTEAEVKRLLLNPRFVRKHKALAKRMRDDAWKHFMINSISERSPVSQHAIHLMMEMGGLFRRYSNDL